MADYYDTLEVTRSASQGDIKRAYRRLAHQYHPDKNPAQSSDERFKAINEAHAVLGDLQRRAEYDAMADSGRYSPAAIDDFFRNFFAAQSNSSSPFAEAFSNSVSLTLVITPAEALAGATKSVRWGEGVVGLQIPPRTAHHQLLQLSLPDGRLDARIQIKLEPPFFWYEARAALELFITLPQALSGAEITFMGLDAKPSRLRLRPGVQPGQLLRLPGRGLPLPNGDRDDLYVKIKIQLPQLSDEGRRAFEAFARKYL